MTLPGSPERLALALLTWSTDMDRAFKEMAEVFPMMEQEIDDLMTRVHDMVSNMLKQLNVIEEELSDRPNDRQRYD